MSAHSSTLVPIEAWSYNSPELRFAGKSIDIGLLAEALIYYDQVLVNVTNQPQFALLLDWFISQRKYADLLTLLEDETIRLYDYSFATAAIFDEISNTYIIMNIQDPIQQQPNTFEERFLYHPSLNGCFKSSSERKRLYKTVRGKVIEVKASDFGSAIENARQDYLDPRRNALLIQALVDEVYPSLGLGAPPSVRASVEDDTHGNRISYNMDLQHLKRSLGPNLNFHVGAPLTAIAHCNRLLWSAAQQQCDLYLGNPMASLVGDKLYESNLRAAKLKEHITQLDHEVEFPNIRKLTNDGTLDLSEILRIRKKAKRFRDWLQRESDRDRNAIIAYHNEVAKELGIVKFGRKSLRLFGLLGPPIAEAYVTHNYPGTGPAIIAAGAGAGMGFVLAVASKIGEEWKPVVFGNWARDRIQKLLGER